MAANRGGVRRETLERLVAEGRSANEIARTLDRSQSTVRHWLRRYDLSTRREREREDVESNTTMRTCTTHGWTEFVRYSSTDAFRCRRCRCRAVSQRRRAVKERLVAEFGGACQICGYSRFAGALQFHHLDPGTKAFGLALNGSARSLERAREEAGKCVLLCANCHAEVEWGDATLPPVSA